jgi:8-oxo-dGTP diphosphatase/2-hydroxy-dATP diphosphatase
MIKPYTLVMIQKDNQILLGMKKRGFGAGWWNGFGGKVMEGENIEAAAIREVKEEVGLVAKNLRPRGVLHFTFEDEDKIHEATLFECREFEGDPIESEEMKPQWFNITEMPYSEMWPADKIWFPVYLEGRSITGNFHFTKERKVGSYNLEEIKTQ